MLFRSNLLLQLKRNKFRGRAMAMTAYGNQAIYDRILELGGLDTIVKPFDLDWFKKKLLDFFQRQSGFNGTVDAIDLPSILQVLHIEKKTAAVQVHSGQDKGLINFDDGEIVHAEFGPLAGETAVRTMIGQNKGRFSVLKKK
jgi:response regulator of citrate/malate metabolism